MLINFIDYKDRGEKKAITSITIKRLNDDSMNGLAENQKNDRGFNVIYGNVVVNFQTEDGKKYYFQLDSEIEVKEE